MTVQINNFQRQFISEIFKDVSISKIGDGEIENKIKKDIDPLREKNPNLYKMVVGMFFTDFYCNLAYNKTYLSLDDDEQKNWKFLNQMNSITDVIKAIDEDKISLLHMAESSFSFTLKGLYEQFLCYNAVDIKFLSKFSPYTFFEFIQLSQPCTLEEVVEEYQKIVEEFSNGEADDENEDEEKLEDLEFQSAIADTIYNFKERLLILSCTNESAFKRIMVEIIKDYYRLSKTFEFNHVYSLSKEDFEIFAVIETKSIDEIITFFKQNSELLVFIIDIYLDYKVNSSEFEETEIDESYDEIPEEIRNKLESTFEFEK